MPIAQAIALNDVCADGSRSSEPRQTGIEQDDFELGRDSSVCIGFGLPLAVARVVEDTPDEDPRQLSVGVLSPRASECDCAEYVSATVTRNRAEVKLGVRMTEGKNKNMYISSIQGKGLFGHSPLRVGDMLVSINGVSCAGLPPKKVTELLSNAVGTITIVVRNKRGNPMLVESFVQRPNNSGTPHAGLIFANTTRGSLELADVSDVGPFAHSLLNRGSRVISINQIGCHGLMPTAANELMQAFPRHITILAETKRCTGVVVATMADGVDASLSLSPSPSPSPSRTDKRNMLKRALSQKLFLRTRPKHLHTARTRISPRS